MRLRRGCKNTQKNCTKKVLMTQITMMVWSLTQSQIFWEYKVKWVLGSITSSKASRGDAAAVELFKILKDDAVKVLHSVCQQIWKTHNDHKTGKGQFSFQSQKRQCQGIFKLPNNCIHFTCQQADAQNSSSQSSAVREPRPSRCSSWI